MLTFRRIATALLATALIGGCVPKEQPSAPEPRPLPPPVARPAPPPPPAPAQGWAELPLTPGGWSYAGTAQSAEAVFGQGAFTLRCDRAGRRVSLSRAGATGPLVIRTSAGSRSVDGAPPSLAADDRFLDSMVFSRGRFTVEASALPTLVIPAWPEPARVLEECRL